MSQKQLIRRELKAARERIRGRVIGDPYPLAFDPSGSNFPVFVAPGVDTGGVRLLERVPIKINGPQARLYARNGSPVFLEKDAQGRYQIVGPADRAPQAGSLKTINEDTDVTTAANGVGFTTVREAFEYYQGVTPESFFDPGADANTLVWLRAYDRALGAPDNIVLSSDVDGADVVAITDKSGNGHSPIQTTAGLFPLYRKFDATSNNANERSVADFDGVNDELTFPAAVTESIGGQISIFILLNKDAVGAGDDIVLELDNWRVYSRRAAGDTWGFNQGGGVQDSGSTLDSNYVLIEIIATSFADIAVYQDGTLLASFTPGGGGLSLGSSTFGGSATLASHDGRVAELLVMDETVSALKRQAIEAYFNQTMFVNFARWNNGVDGFPKIRTLDANGNEVTL